MLAASAPKIVGIKAAKIESPIAANGPIKPVFKPETVCFPAMPSFSSMAKSIPVIIVLKKFEVLKNCVCVFITSFNSGVSSP